MGSVGQNQAHYVSSSSPGGSSSQTSPGIGLVKFAECRYRGKAAVYNCRLVRFSSVQFSSMHFQTTRFSEVLKEVGFEPHRNCPLEMDDLHRCSSRLLRSSKTEASVTEFHCCSWHSKISVFHRTEIGLAREIHRRYADVLEVCSISTSDTVKCKECNLELYLLRHRPPV